MADAKPAVERLSEDESLRGDLSDIGFGPLLDWAVAAVQAFASKAAGSDALDAYTSRVRGVVQSAVQAAQDSKLADPTALLDYDPAGKEKVLTALKALKLGDDPDDNAVQIAAVLQSGLTAEGASPAPGGTAPASNENTASPAPTLPIEAPASSVPAREAPEQEAARPQPDRPAEPAPAPEKEAAKPLKKNEQEGESASPSPPADQSPNLNQSPEPPANPAPSNPRPGTFLDNLRSGVGQAYNSARGIFKGLSKRRSG